MNFIISISLLALCLSACGGGGFIGPSKTIAAGVDSFTELSPQFEALIESRFSSRPDIKQAAQGFGKNLLQYWGSAQATGAYSEALSLRSANAQNCLASRLERYGQRLRHEDIANILAALTTTQNLLNAYKTADSLASGHAKILFSQEAEACPAAGIQ